jgi:Flp pilus assembly protein TadG
MKILRDFLKRQGFLKQQNGASAAEFAIIAPILAGMVIFGYDTWLLINRKQDMHAAINASAHYYMGGGGDDTTGQSIGLSGWPNKPTDAQLLIARACSCAGAAADCSTVCTATQQAPEIHITMTAKTQWNGMTPAALSESENVRVR